MSNLQLGVCMLCGEKCNQHRYTHSKCAEVYFEAKRSSMKLKVKSPLSNNTTTETTTETFK